MPGAKGIQRQLLSRWKLFTANSSGWPSIIFGENEKTFSVRPTELVHELYLRLEGSAQFRFESRGHFFGFAAHVLRKVLIDLARRRSAAKRGGGATRVTIDGLALSVCEGRSLDYLALEQALKALEDLDPRAARVVEMRFFAQMTDQEIAEALGCSTKTVTRDWEWARGWLLSYLDRAKS